MARSRAMNIDLVSVTDLLRTGNTPGRNDEPPFAI
jgi:hypothetical protein